MSQILARFRFIARSRGSAAGNLITLLLLLGIIGLGVYLSSCTARVRRISQRLGRPPTPLLLSARTRRTETRRHRSSPSTARRRSKPPRLTCRRTTRCRSISANTPGTAA